MALTSLNEVDRESDPASTKRHASANWSPQPSMNPHDTWEGSVPRASRDHEHRQQSGLYEDMPFHTSHTCPIRGPGRPSFSCLNELSTLSLSEAAYIQVAHEIDSADGIDATLESRVHCNSGASEGGSPRNRSYRKCSVTQSQTTHLSRPAARS